MLSFSPIRPRHPINQMAHETPLECTRSNGQDPTMKTQVLESVEALTIPWNKPPSKNGVPPLLETPNGAPSLLLYLWLV